MPSDKMTEEQLARFLDKVIISPDGCWEWMAYRDTCGYGIFRLGDRMYTAHRVAYEHFVGPIPEGKEMDHLCRNRGCASPYHVEPVTHAENIGRSPLKCPTHCKRGHELTPANRYAGGPRKGRGRCRQCALDRSRLQREQCNALGC